MRAHAVAALNFFVPLSGAALILGVMQQIISAAGVGLISWLGAGLLDLVLFALFLVGIIFGVLAGTKANQGTLYKYPFSLNLFK